MPFEERKNPLEGHQKPLKWEFDFMNFTVKVIFGEKFKIIVYLNPLKNDSIAI